MFTDGNYTPFWGRNHRTSSHCLSDISGYRVPVQRLQQQEARLRYPIFEQLLAENPDNPIVKRRYKRFCYEWITYRLLTRRNVGKGILKRCLRLQKIIVKLETDDPESMASLAYFLARLNKLDEAIAVMQKAIHLDPEDLTLRDTLELYLELASAHNQS